MNNYKELIAELRKRQTLGDAPVGNGFGVIVDKLTLKQAADAIERLCTDVARLEAEIRAKEQYIAETIGDGFLQCSVVRDYCERQREFLNKFPTVDAVPVVRCKDCVHYSLHDAAGGRYCEILRNESPIESGYCCYGERRSE